MMYTGFADIYDALMSDVDYGAWAAYYIGLVERAGVTVRRAADCACGTGSMTLALAEYGIDMTGIDTSEDMLRVAAAKARAAGRQIPFIRQDMQRLSLHRPVDAVFCACDGVNYLLKPENVQGFFCAVHQALRPGGGFFFDVSTRHKLAHVLGDHSLAADDGGKGAYIWQNHYHGATHRIQMDLTFFAREADGRYRRFTETHIQRGHTQEELVHWLEAAGFSGIQAYGDRHFLPPAQDAQRMHVMAIRP